MITFIKNENTEPRKLITDESEQGYYAFLETEYQRYQKQRYYEEATWWQNQAMVRGWQNYQFNRETRRFEVMRKLRVQGRPRRIVNKMQPYHSKNLARLTQTPIAVSVQPSSSSDLDVKNTKLEEAIIEHRSRELGIQQIYDRLADYALLHCTSFLHVYWDPTEGQCIPCSNEHLGAVVWEVIPAFRLFAEFEADDTKDLQRFMKVSVRPVDYVWRKWGIRIEAEKINSVSLSFHDRLSTFGPSGAASNDGEFNEPSVIIKQEWIRPCEQFPNGQIIIGAAGKLLESPKEIDNKEHEFYLFKFDDIRISGRLYGRSRHEDATSIQWERNKIITQLDENRDLHGRPKLAMPRGSNLKKSNISTSAREVWEYNAESSPPGYIEPAQMPVWVREQIARCDADMDQNYSLTLHPDRTPPGVVSGRAIESLKEENDSPYSPVIRQWSAAKAKAWRAHLLLEQQYVKEPRDLPKIDIGNITEKKTYIGSDIKEVEVDIDPGASMPKSKVAIKMVIEQNWQNGLYGNPQDPQTLRHVRKLMEINQVEVPQTDEDVEERNALHGCRLVQAGEEVRILPFDINAVWIMVFERFLRDHRYTLKDDEVERLYIHLEMRKEAAMAAAAANNEPNMPPPPPPEASMPPGPGGGEIPPGAGPPVQGPAPEQVPIPNQPLPSDRALELVQ